MFTTAEYLSLAPWPALIKIINDQAYLQLDHKSAKLVGFKALGNQRIEVVIDPNRSASKQNILPPIGNQTFTMTRLVLGEYFNNPTVFNLNGLPLPINTVDVVAMIGQAKGVVFDVDDFVHQQFSAYPTGQVVLKAHPDSLRWEGNLAVSFTNTLKVDLAKINDSQLPDAFTYPNGDATRIQGAYCLNAFDFTPYRYLLKSLGWYTHTVDGEALAMIMTRITGEHWVCSATPAPRNIATQVVDGVARYSVIYHGATTRRYTPRTDRKQVIILDLDPTLCTDVAGPLRVHYD